MPVYREGASAEYGPAEPYRHRNTLGDPWSDPDEVRPHFQFLEGRRNRPFLGPALRRLARRLDRAVVDTLLGRR